MTEAASRDASVARVVEILRVGGLVAFPTETVYGLGADAENRDALRRLYAVKGRPPEHPVIVHLADAAQLDDWGVDVPDAAHALAAACWPGPLTVVVRRAARVPDEATGGLETVGLRVPAHPLARELLRAFGGGLAAPSANRFGRVSPTTAAAVQADLGDDVDLVLDGGACTVGVESTIVDCTADPPRVLRAGGVTAEALTEILGHEVPIGGSTRCAGNARVALLAASARGARRRTCARDASGSARTSRNARRRPRRARVDRRHDCADRDVGHTARRGRVRPPALRRAPEGR